MTTNVQYPFFRKWTNDYLLVSGLYEPDWGKKSLFSLNDLCSRRCLIFLGEPNSGKSHEVRKFTDSTRNSLMVDLKDVGDKDLFNYLSENFEFKEFLLGDLPFNLFFDSLDEISIGEKVIAKLNLFLDKLDKCFISSSSKSMGTELYWPKVLARANLTQIHDLYTVHEKAINSDPGNVLIEPLKP